MSITKRKLFSAVLFAGLMLMTASIAFARPVANAGPDVTINSDRYHLNASLSTDVTGLLNCDILWTKITGPAEAVISHPTLAITPIINLNMGVYTFRLTVTDFAGVSSSDDVVVTVPTEQVKDKVDEFIVATIEKAGVKGMSVAIIDKGKIVKMKGYGFTDADKTTPVTPLTLFQAASTSKILTTSGTLRLVDKNLLSLDEDVNKKLTSWKVPENQFTKDEKVTLRRLITHRAGINMSGFYGYPRGVQVPTLLQVLDGLPPANSSPLRVGIIPGTKNQYSGGGFTIIQQLIIDVTGQSFDNYMKDSIFDKLGMASSSFEQLPSEKWDFAAHGYGYAMPDGKSYEHKEMRWKWNNFPEKAAAGMWTTAGDLALYMIDLQDTYAGRSSKVISKEMAEKMFTLAPGEKYLTLGLVLLKFSETATEFRFSGTNAGFQCGSFGTVNTGQGCVIMYNDRQGEMFPEEIKMIIAKEYGWPK